MKTKKKRQSLPSVKKKVWAVFSKYIRLRDCLFTTRTKESGRCITCEMRLPFKELQAGHYVAGRNSSILFDEESVHAQCYICNVVKKGNPHIYRKKIEDLYGDRYYEVLEKRAQEIKKFTIPELLELETYYENKLKQLEEI